MDPTVVAFLRSWSFEPWTVAGCVVTAIIYWRGWRALVRRGSEQFGVRHLVMFLAGLATIAAAVCSPLESFASLLLSVHMAQHLLLMIVAPVLIAAAAPELPLAHGLPAPILEYWVTPFLHLRAVRAIGRAAANPFVAWTAAAVILWFWHVPRFYELTLEVAFWHRLEHASFFISALLFWWPVVQPYPARPRWPRVAIVPYLFLAAMQASVLCAFLTFSDRVLYPHYRAVGGLWGMSPLTDQAAAGALMWIAGMVAYLVPMASIAHTLLYGRRRDTATRDCAKASAVELRPAMPFDMLRMPLVGHLLQWPYSRRLLQAALLAVATAIVLDGLTGPQAAPLNLAGVLPWIHWRGLVVLGLLVGGNFFCAVCPITLPRAVLRRFVTPAWEWPPLLRSKYLAVTLLVGFFWAYEALDLWASPWWTAWIVLGYFVVAFAIDALFRGAAFCKYVCPIGQFQFVQSLVSPWEVRVRDAGVCSTCRTKECIRGSENVRGCEMNLIVPRKASNLDCTFCLDCVQACPVANVGVLAILPVSQLAVDEEQVAVRHGLPDQLDRAVTPRPFARPDVALLIFCLVFAAFANAAGMIGPVVASQDRATAASGVPRFAVENAYLLVVLIIAPLALVVAASLATCRAAGDKEGTVRVAARFASAFVPLGAAMWLAHYGFHLATGATACVPATARFLNDWGWPAARAENLVRSCCAIEPPQWLLRAEIMALDVGLLATLYLAYSTSTAWHRQRRRAAAAFLPWGALAVGLFLLGVWILYQPMEMRGTLTAGSAG